MLGFLTLHPPAFGLDISDRSLKAAHIEKGKQGFRLLSWGEGVLEQGIIEAGEIKQEERLVSSLRTLVSQVKGRKIRTNYVVAALPEEKAFVQVVQLPRMKKEEVASAIRFQAENYIPYPIDSVYLDFALIPPFHDHLDHLDVLIASLPRIVVDSYVNALGKAGLKPVVLEIEAFALARVLVEKSVSPVPLLLVDVGKEGSRVSVYSGYSVRFTSSVSIGSDDFTNAVERALAIPEEKAEELKKTYGLYASPEALGQEVFQALIPVVSDFAEQLGKYIEYYETHISHHHLGKRRPPKIARIILCGGGANLPGLPEVLTRELKIETVIGNPWVNILAKDTNELPPLSFQKSLSYSIALGLALRGAQQKKRYAQPLTTTL